eukprot:1115406-Rhodomonas_salina.2
MDGSPSHPFQAVPADPSVPGFPPDQQPPAVRGHHPAPSDRVLRSVPRFQGGLEGQGGTARCIAWIRAHTTKENC